MNVKQAKELVGKYGLFQIGDAIEDGTVRQVSPSGNYIEVGYGWFPIEKVTFLEALPEASKPVLLAATVAQGGQTGAETAGTALDALTATNQKLQGQNTILNEQLAQASREITALKMALTEDKPVLAAAPPAQAGAALPVESQTGPTGETGQTLTFPTTQS